MKLLQQLCEIPGASGSEERIKNFILDYINKQKKNWSVAPEIIKGDEIQDCIILRFGKPRTAIFAHLDTVGFTVRYFDQLVTIGSPDAPKGTMLVGEDSQGQIECELDFDSEHHALYNFGRAIDRGTSLTYKVNFKDSNAFIESPYLDNRLGVYNALKIAETLRDGIIAFSCWEEHGGGSVPFLTQLIYERWKIKQALISDITWATDGIEPGKGVVISLRDRHIPRQAFIQRIIEIANKSEIDYQLEVEGVGSSDGGEVQRSPYPIDWVFVGAPQMNPHTPFEKVHKHDISQMVDFYKVLMNIL